MNRESPNMYTIEPTLDPIIGIPMCKPKDSTGNFTSKQILPFAFEEQHSDQENPG